MDVCSAASAGSGIGPSEPPGASAWLFNFCRGPLFAAVLAILTLGRANAQEPSEFHPPSSPVSTVAAVDAFIEALNRADTASMAEAFTPNAKAWTFGVDERGFLPGDWLPHPWDWYPLQAGLGYHVPDGGSLQVTVTDRMVADNMVIQRERIRAYPDGRTARQLSMLTIYRVRGGRIHDIWYAGSEARPLDVPFVETPTHAPGTGPTVWLDVAHGNTAAPEGSFWNLSELLHREGYRVRPWWGRFDAAALDSVEILVIANPAPVVADSGPGMAFTTGEVTALRDWVAGGGGLLLAVDHAPYPRYSAPLASAFGATFYDGFARDTAREQSGNILFRRDEGLLRPHPITDGSGQRVDAVATLLGQAFQAAPGLEPLMVLPETTILIPEGRGTMTDTVAAGGWLQGAAATHGRGRVAIFGEVWMFRYFRGNNPQLAGAQNARFVRNLFRWLGGR